MNNQVGACKIGSLMSLFKSRIFKLATNDNVCANGGVAIVDDSEGFELNRVEF